MQNILDDIVSHKKKELTVKKKMERIFASNISYVSKGDIGLIAEIKLQSPSGGKLGDISSVPERIKEYTDYGADAISVVTDTRFFGGSPELLKVVKRYTGLPILQKDFVIDPYQIYEAKMNGADALLLIARILDEERLQKFVDLSSELSIEPVVEVYDDGDLKKALKTSARVIGVNARNLDTFKIDIDGACKLLNEIPADKVKIGFSGVTSRKEVDIYKKAGAHAILVGTSLMKAADIGKYIKNLKHI